MKVFNERFTFPISGCSRRSFEVSICGIPVGVVLDVRKSRGGLLKKRMLDVDVFIAIPEEYKYKQTGGGQ